MAMWKNRSLYVVRSEWVAERKMEAVLRATR